MSRTNFVTVLFVSLFWTFLSPFAHAQVRCESSHDLEAHHFRQAPPAPRPMLEKYQGEEADGVNVDVGPSPSGRRILFMKVRYLSEGEQALFRASIDAQGILRHRQSRASLNFVFVVLRNGQLLVAPILTGQSPFARTKHSALAQGKPVLMAGELEINPDGKIFSVSNDSGHYQPTSSELQWFLREYIPNYPMTRVRVLDRTSGTR